MTEFLGRVDIKKGSTPSTPLISLDGIRENIIIFQGDGTERIRIGLYGDVSLGGPGPSYTFMMNDYYGETITELGGGYLVLGGAGIPGRLNLINQEGKNTMTLDGGKGDIILANADCAEDFDILESEEIEPGDVMVVEHESKLRQSSQAYDKRVVGVISGACDNKPGIVLDRKNSQTKRKPVALMGKVYCKVDARSFPVEVGDLLTTSSIPGHAMKAEDPFRAFGAVIGKALQSIKYGKGLIPILISLQ